MFFRIVKIFNFSGVFLALSLTVRIAAGGGFENRLPGGDAEKKYDYKIIEKILRTSQAQN